MKHIYIIRHGETDNNKVHRFQGRGINASINETGRQQAEAIAHALKDVPIQKVVTSSLIRTLETAEPLIEQSQAVVESYPDLDEMSFGKYEGSYIHEIMDTIKELQKRWSAGETDYAIEGGGESPQEVYDRAATKLVEVVKNSDENYIAFMLHGRLIRILLSGLLGLGLENMQDIKHTNGAINHLVWNGKEFEIVELNKTDHLKNVTISQGK